MHEHTHGHHQATLSNNNICFSFNNLHTTSGAQLLKIKKKLKLNSKIHYIFLYKFSIIHHGIDIGIYVNLIVLMFTFIIIIKCMK